MSDFELLIKLFDTLKDSSKETQQLCHTVLTNQQNIGNYIKTLPMTDLKDALKEHSKDSSQDIGTCKDKVEATGIDLMKELKGMATKINRMILVVIVAFTIVTGGYLIMRSAVDTSKDFSTWKKQYEEIEKETSKEQQHLMDERLDQFMKKVIEEMNKRHTNYPGIENRETNSTSE